MNDSPKKIRRLTISVRGLILLVLIVGFPLGWRIRSAREQREVVRALRAGHAQIRYGWEFVDGQYRPGGKPRGPEWLRRRLGDDYFQEVEFVNFAATLPQRSPWDRENAPPGKEAEAAIKLDRALETLRALPDCRMLGITGPQLSDAHLARIRDLPALETLMIDRASNLTEAGLGFLEGQRPLKTLAINDSNLDDPCVDRIGAILSLEEVDLRGTRITDAHLDRLARLPKLRFLSLGLGLTEITDAGMAAIRKIRSLEYLNIENTKVSDAGLSALAALPRIKLVWAAGSRITTDGIKRFQATRPDVRVITGLDALAPPLRLRYP